MRRNWEGCRYPIFEGLEPRLLLSGSVEPAIGDFNGDGDVNAGDIDMLAGVLGSTVPPTDSMYDLFGDGVIDNADWIAMIEDVLGTKQGDADLDGDVDFDDFGELAFGYKKPGGWADGDFDGNGLVDFDDFSYLASNYNWVAPVTLYVDDATDPLEDGSLAHPFDSIQEAIDLTNEGDEVVVMPGTYYESIVFPGYDITVRSLDPQDPDVVASTIIGNRDYFFSLYQGTIVDNQDPGFSTAGTWTESDTVDEYAGSSLNTGELGATATWTPPGYYRGPIEVSAWWSDELPGGGSQDSDSAARYSFSFKKSRDFVTVVDQNQNSGQWNVLGTYTSSYGAEAQVTLTRASGDGAVTNADAVRLVSVVDRWASLSGVVTFQGSESGACVLAGLTITGGKYGIAGNGTLATIENNHITGNGGSWMEPPHDMFYVGGGVSDCDGVIQYNNISGNVPTGVTGCDGLIESNVISNNSGPGGGGLSGCHGTIRGNVISGNSALVFVPGGTFGSGGGMSGCNALIDGNVFIGNQAGSGGAIAGGNVTMVNCVFVGNTSRHEAGDDGGTMYRVSGTIANSIFVSGGAIDSDAVFNNCIVSVPIGAHHNPQLPTFRFSNVIGSGGSGADWDTGFGTDGGGNIDADPMYVNAADPNGPDDLWFTEDDGLRLLSGSPCVDAGDGDVAPATDVLGEPRYDYPVTPNTGMGTPDYSDIGTYEFGGHPVSYEIIVDNLDPGFSSSAGWDESAAVDEYAGSSFYTNELGRTASWTPNLPSAGLWKVYAWWSAEWSNGDYLDRDSTADYTIYHAGGQDTVTMDQDLNSGQWNLLGSFAFDAGISGYVELLRDAEDGDATSADAVWFVKVSD